MRLPRSRSLAMRTKTNPPCSRSPSRVNLKSPFASACSGVLVPVRLPITAVPQHDRAAAILTLGNRPFEVAVIERMIFDLDRKPLVMGIERRPFGDSPGFENAIQLEPQIVVEAGGVVLLNDESATGRGLDSVLAAWLPRLPKSRFAL